MTDEEQALLEVGAFIEKVGNAITKLDATQADTNALIDQLTRATNELADRVNSYLEVQTKLVEECRRAIELVYEDDGRRGVRKVKR